MRFLKVNVTGWKGLRYALMALCALSLTVPVMQPAEAQGRASRDSLQSNNDRRPNPAQTRPLPEIVARVQATPPYNDMDYIGVAGFEERQMIYILRFIDGRQVIAVQVDARSGRIIGRSPR